MTRAGDRVISPDPSDERALHELDAHIEAMFETGLRPVLMGPKGEHIELPETVFDALCFVVHGMAAGQTITLMPVGAQLTTQAAAELLHVSRPHLVKMLDRGEIPFEKVGSHRRLVIDDVLEYRAMRAETRQERLRELTRLSQEVEPEYR